MTSSRQDTEAQASGEESATEPLAERPKARHPKLSLGTRVLVFVAGWSLLLVGVAGLALPGIQGILTLLIGAAVLSVASETVYRLLKKMFRRWPKGMDTLDRFRDKIHSWLHRKS